MKADVFKTDYPELYKYHCKGYLGQTLASDCKKSLRGAISKWPKGNYTVLGRIDGYANKQK